MDLLRDRPLSADVSRPVQRGTLWVATLTTALLAFSEIGTALHRAIAPIGRYDGIDLLFRWREVQFWFQGKPIYTALEHADYPPATQAILWPFLGWLEPPHTRWLWFASAIFVLGWLMSTLARESGLRTALARTCVGLIPAAAYATGATLIVGQTTIHVLACSLAGLLLLTRENSWRSDLLGSALVIASLAKPTLAVPLVWVAVLVPGRLRPAFLIGGGYAALTLFAASFQKASVIELLQAWLHQSGKVGVSKTAANIQVFLQGLGLGDAFLPIALGVLVATGAWVWRHRGVDVWILIGVTALVARFWSYHREFDDLITLFPAVALLRLARFTRSGVTDAIAGALGVSILALFLAPYPQIRELGLRWAVNWVVTGTWLAALAYLLFAAARQRKQAGLTGAREVFAAATTASDLPERATRRTDERVWLWICTSLPLLVLAGAYAWLGVVHATPWLRNEIVHESGRYTLAQTIFYFSHFVREIPTLIAMVLFLLAAVGVPHRRVFRASAAQRRQFVVALATACALALAALAIAARELGAREALRHLFQSYTRDDVAAFGSHWRYHWLSTLWFAAAAPVAVRIGSAWLGAAQRERSGSLQLAAWAFFAALTLAFGLSKQIVTDPLYVGHQAREIATHALVTLPLALAVVAWLDRRHTSAAPPDSRLEPRLRWYEIAAVVSIAAYLGIAGLAGNVVASGQTAGGLAAMLGAHFFEHALDYVFVALALAGCYGLLRSRVGVAAGAPAR